VRILIVDDSPVNIQILSAILERDYEIFFATGGARALELAGEKEVDHAQEDVQIGAYGLWITFQEITQPFWNGEGRQGS
jgi:CheY-like chemotaxis protein